MAFKALHVSKKIYSAQLNIIHGKKKKKKKRMLEDNPSITFLAHGAICTYFDQSLLYCLF